MARQKKVSPPTQDAASYQHPEAGLPARPEIGIREVVLRRFKRFEEETFDLSGHVILAGPNNCGKTTVLQAIAAWSLGLKRWRELNDFQRHGGPRRSYHGLVRRVPDDVRPGLGSYAKAPLARQAFASVPLRSYDLLWKDRSYSGSIEIEVTLTDGRKVTMEFESDSTEQIYVRPRKDVDPVILRDLSLDVVYVAPEEIHPEVKEKLDFIQRAFGL